jgi:hypothetical protein
MNPLDFGILGHLKGLIYRDQPTDMEDLVQRLHTAVVTIDVNVLWQVQVSILQYPLACQKMQGVYFEHTM